MPQSNTSHGLGFGLPLLGGVNGSSADDNLNLVITDDSDYVVTDDGDFWIWS